MNAPVLTAMAQSVAHAFLPPSGAAAWVHCAAWPHMNAAYPQPDTQDTLEGSAAHWAFAEMLYGRPVAVGQIVPNGVTLDDEMIEAAELFVEVVDDALAECGLDRSHLRVEWRTTIPSIHEHNWGTPDVWFYDPKSGRLFVIDFKYGHGFVDAFENWQCLDYAAGILDGMGVNGLQDQAIRVEIVIVQPRNYDRAGPVRRWSVIAAELRGYFNRLRNAAEAALQPIRSSVVGDHCEHCPGRHACTTLQRAGYMAVHKSKQTVPVELPADALGLELRTLRRAAADLKARLSGLEQEAETRMRLKGERIPGHAIVDTYGRESWNKPPAEVIAIAQAMNVNISKPAILTPKQAIKAGLNPDVVKAFSTTPKTGVKLVPDDGTLARKVFSK